MEAFAPSAFLLPHTHTHVQHSQAPRACGATLCATATTVVNVRDSTHLLAALRPAPAVVHRYAGQGDRTLLAQNLDALFAPVSTGACRLSPCTRPM
jgi:hypothetical protein